MMITMRTTRRRSNTGRLLTLGAMSGKGAEVRRFCFAAKKLEEDDEDEDDHDDDPGDGNCQFGKEYYGVRLTTSEKGLRGDVDGGTIANVVRA